MNNQKYNFPLENYTREKLYDTYFISLLRFLPRRVPDRIDSSSVNPRSDFSTSESRDTVRGSVRGALTIPPGGLPPPADRANILPCCVLVP